MNDKERFNRFKKNKTRLVVWLDNEDFKKFSHAARLCGASKARLMRSLIECYMQRLESAREE